MQKKPIHITLMTFLFIVLTIALPTQIMVIFKLMPWDISLIYSKLTPLNIVLMISFTIMAILTYRMDKRLYIALPIVTLFVFLNNFIVAEYGQLFSHLQATASSVAFLGLVFSYYRPALANVYKNESSRWWLSAPRMKQSYPVTLVSNDVTVQSQTFDLSESGIFIINDDTESILNFKKDSEIKIQLETPNSSIELVAKIVRKTIARGSYPSGIGVQILKTKSSGYQDFSNNLCAN